MMKGNVMSAMKTIYTAYTQSEGTTFDRVRAACEAAAPHEKDDRLSREIYLMVVADLFESSAPGLSGSENDPEAINEVLEYPELDEAMDISNVYPYYADQLKLITKYADLDTDVEFLPDTEYGSLTIRELLPCMAQAVLDEHVSASLAKISGVWEVVCE